MTAGIFPISPEILPQIFTVLVFNELAIIGFYTATWYKQSDTDNHEPEEESKMALWKIKYFSLKYLGEFWSKPVCTCPPCMSSLHSLWYWLFFPFTWTYVIIYIMYILALAGLSKLLVAWFDL